LVEPVVGSFFVSPSEDVSFPVVPFPFEDESSPFTPLPFESVVDESLPPGSFVPPERSFSSFSVALNFTRMSYLLSLLNPGIPDTIMSTWPSTMRDKSATGTSTRRLSPFVSTVVTSRYVPPVFTRNDCHHLSWFNQIRTYVVPFFLYV